MLHVDVSGNYLLSGVEFDAERHSWSVGVSITAVQCDIYTLMVEHGVNQSSKAAWVKVTAAERGHFFKRSLQVGLLTRRIWAQRTQDVNLIKDGTGASKKQYLWNPLPITMGKRK